MIIANIWCGMRQRKVNKLFSYTFHFICVRMLYGDINV